MCSPSSSSPPTIGTVAATMSGPRTAGLPGDQKDATPAMTAAGNWMYPAWSLEYPATSCTHCEKP